MCAQIWPVVSSLAGEGAKTHTDSRKIRSNDAHYDRKRMLLQAIRAIMSMTGKRRANSIVIWPRDPLCLRVGSIYSHLRYALVLSMAFLSAENPS